MLYHLDSWWIREFPDAVGLLDDHLHGYHSPAVLSAAITELGEGGKTGRGERRRGKGRKWNRKEERGGEGGESVGD